MFGTRSTGSNQPTILVTQGDTWAGFYATWALLKYHHKTSVARVITAVRNRNNEFVRELERMGAEIRDYDSSADRAKFQKDLFRQEVDGLVLIPVHDDQNMVNSTEELLAAASDDQKVQCLVLWSVMGLENMAEIKNPNWKMIMQQLVQIEKLVKSAKVEHEVIVRHGYVAQQFFALSQVIQNRGIFPFVSKSNKFAAANAKDVARVSAMLISTRDNMNKHNHQVLNLTGPKPYTAQEITEIMNSTLKSSKIEFKELSMQDMEDILIDNEEVDSVEVSKTMFLLQLIANNKLAQVSPDLQKFLGHAPLDLDVFFKENADSFRPRAQQVNSVPYINDLNKDMKSK